MHASAADDDDNRRTPDEILAGHRLERLASKPPELLEFLRSTCDLHPELSASRGELYRAFAEHEVRRCGAALLPADREFGDWVAALGFQAKRRKSGVVYLGLEPRRPQRRRDRGRKARARAPRPVRREQERERAGFRSAFRSANFPADADGAYEWRAFVALAGGPCYAWTRNDGAKLNDARSEARSKERLAAFRERLAEWDEQRERRWAAGGRPG